MVVVTFVCDRWEVPEQLGGAPGPIKDNFGQDVCLVDLGSIRQSYGTIVSTIKRVSESGFDSKT